MNFAFPVELFYMANAVPQDRYPHAPGFEGRPMGCRRYVHVFWPCETYLLRAEETIEESA